MRESASSDKTYGHPQPGSAHVAKAADVVREKLSARATERAVERGSNEPWSCSRNVSIAEVDERRPAHTSPFGEEPSGPKVGLAPQRESAS